MLKAFTETLDQNSNEQNNSARSVRLQLQDGDWALAGDLLWDGVCEQPFTSHHGFETFDFDFDETTFHLPSLNMSEISAKTQTLDVYTRCKMKQNIHIQPSVYSLTIHSHPGVSTAPFLYIEALRCHPGGPNPGRMPHRGCH